MYSTTFEPVLYIYAVIPIIFFCLAVTAALTVYFFFTVMDTSAHRGGSRDGSGGEGVKDGGSKDPESSMAQFLWMRNTVKTGSLKVLVIALYLTYVPICAVSMATFNCRQLGDAGSYLRTDYTVMCGGESSRYKSIFSIGVVGVVFWVLGVPAFFAVVIRSRNLPVFQDAARLLYMPEQQRYRYYEILELFRKFLLTSAVQFVAPGTDSQCLYLFLVDNAFFLILCTHKPFLDPVNICSC